MNAHGFLDRRDDLRRLLDDDRPAFGIWSGLPDPAVAELLASTAFDFLVVDLQHGAATYADLPDQSRAMRTLGRAPLVRVPWNRPELIMRALDIGACGVIVPMVSSADEAAAAAAACRFPPDGQRSWGPMFADARADGALPPEVQNAGVLCLVMVETRRGVENLDAIVRTPGVDGVFIGPNDLALGCGLGRLTYRESPDVDDLLQRIADACRAAGVLCGMYCSDTAMAVAWAGRGMRLLTIGQDAGLLRAGAEAAWAALSEAVGGRQGFVPTPTRTRWR